jgi:hypothetical protein
LMVCLPSQRNRERQYPRTRARIPI